MLIRPSPAGTHWRVPWNPWRSLALFRTLREANLGLWHRLSPAEWERDGVHAERGVESIRDIATYYAGHDLNHFAQIEAILASGGTDRPGGEEPGRP